MKNELDYFEMPFAELLNEWVKRRGITHTLAAKQLRVSRQTWYQWTSGRREATHSGPVRTLLKLLDNFEMEVQLDSERQ